VEGLPLKISPTELEIIRQQIKRKINSPLTSSAGRLFDAVSALAGVRGEIDYEAQAAIELEMRAYEEVGENGSYPFTIIEQNGVSIIKLHDLFVARFHNTVARMIVELCRIISSKTGIKQVALSGGVFQNRLLLKLATAALQKEGFDVLIHHLVPCNDGGVSLGQAVVANFARS
jgi:hydrogenase maturation protein HypF